MSQNMSTSITDDWLSSSIGTDTITISSDYINTGTGGYVLTAGSNGINWNDYSVNTNLSGQSLEVKGDANFDGDLKVKGKSIVDSLERIEEKLAILRPNEELEERWENLRGLRKAYMELEAEIIEKEKMWNILKK